MIRDTRYTSPEDDAFHERLIASGFDGPFRTSSGSAIFSTELCFAVCLKCAAMVMLEDPLKITKRKTIERGIKVHLDWHEAADR